MDLNNLNSYVQGYFVPSSVEVGQAILKMWEIHNDNNKRRAHFDQKCFYEPMVS